MDPEATWADFLAALQGGDPETASHRLEDLSAWLNRGGLVPAQLASQCLRPTRLSRLLASAAAVLAWAANHLNEGETT
jgi:hypothetical protein